MDEQLNLLAKLMDELWKYSAFRKYSSSLNFFTFCFVAVMLKSLKLFFSPSSVDTQYAIMTKWRLNFRNVCIFIKKEKWKYHTDICIQTLYSVLS